MLSLCFLLQCKKLQIINRIQVKSIIAKSIANSAMATLRYIDSDVKLGFHISKQGDLFNSFERMKETPLRSYQICLGNDRKWGVPTVTVDDARKCRCHLDDYQRYACVHSSLIYNMAGQTDGPSNPSYNRILDNTRRGLTAELDCVAAFDGGGVVVHIGSAKDRERGLSTVRSTIVNVLSNITPATRSLAKGLEIPIDEFVKSRKILLENSAGEGNKLGSTLQEIGEIIARNRSYLPSTNQGNDGYCTSLWCRRGRSWKTKVGKKVLSRVHEKIGLSYLEGFHLNDSRVPFGSHKDRHELLGSGYIFGEERNQEKDGDGFEGLQTLVDLSRKRGLVLIGEPPEMTKDNEKSAGGLWDYQVIRTVCGLDKCTFVCCD